MAEEVRVDPTGYGMFFTAAAGSTNGTVIGSAPAGGEFFSGIEVWVPAGGSITVFVAPAYSVLTGAPVAGPTSPPATGTTLALSNHTSDPIRYFMGLAGGLGLYVTQSSGTITARFV